MEELKAYIQETLPELKELIVELCGIPAPSHHEEKRAEFCRDWLLRNGASPEQVHIDEALNVAVSYTHLDVYKRQPLHPERRAACRGVCPSAGRDRHYARHRKRTL